MSRPGCNALRMIMAVVLGDAVVMMRVSMFAVIVVGDRVVMVIIRRMVMMTCDRMMIARIVVVAMRDLALNLDEVNVRVVAAAVAVDDESWPGRNNAGEERSERCNDDGKGRATSWGHSVASLFTSVDQLSRMSQGETCVNRGHFLLMGTLEMSQRIDDSSRDG